jgi:ATP-binding cassette subfamily B protein
VLGPFLTKIAIDKYLAKSPDSHSWIGDRLSNTPLTGIAQIGGLYVGILILTFALEFVQTYLMQWTGQKVMFDLRRQIFRHLQFMHVAFFDKNPVGRLVTRVTTDVDALNEMFTAGVVSIFEDVFVLAGIIAIMMKMNWKLALITFAVLPLIIYATRVFRDKVRDSYRRIRTAIARINYYLQEAVSGMQVLQLFNREKRAFNKFSEINASHMEAFKDAIMAYSVYYPVVEILSAFAIASIIWFGGNDVVRGITSIGVLVAFMQYAQRFFRPIQDLSEKYNILQSAMAAGERVFKLLDTKIEITSPAVTKKPHGAGRIEFEHVWFAYGNKTSVEKTATPTRTGEPDWILRDVSFVLAPGETIAVVGHTGAGKTTLISLLMRFYDVQKGAILIDGVDIREMNLDDLRGRFGVVLQDPFLFSGTVEGNIRLGTARIQHRDVVQAAEDVNL